MSFRSVTAEHRAADSLLRTQRVPLRVRLVCHVHLAVSRLASRPAPGRRPAASRIGEWEARRRDDA